MRGPAWPPPARMVPRPLGRPPATSVGRRKLDRRRRAGTGGAVGTARLGGGNDPLGPPGGDRVSPAVHCALPVQLGGRGELGTLLPAARVLFENLGQYPPPPQPKIPIASNLSWLLVGAEVVFVIWQYRAAKFARSLGYPARRSPAWGIVAYLVPIADLFIPAQALSDCLPPQHPGRRLVAKTWSLLLAVSVLQSATIVTLALLRPVGVVLVALTVACDVLLLLCGLRMVDAITDHHRHALSQARPSAETSRPDPLQVLCAHSGRRSSLGTSGQQAEAQRDPQLARRSTPDTLGRLPEPGESLPRGSNRSRRATQGAAHDG